MLSTFTDSIVPYSEKKSLSLLSNRSAGKF